MRLAMFGRRIAMSTRLALVVEERTVLAGEAEVKTLALLAKRGVLLDLHFGHSSIFATRLAWRPPSNDA